MVTEAYVTETAIKHGYDYNDVTIRKLIQEVERDTRNGCADSLLAWYDKEGVAYQAVINAVLDAKETVQVEGR